VHGAIFEKTASSTVLQETKKNALSMSAETRGKLVKNWYSDVHLIRRETHRRCNNNNNDDETRSGQELLLTL